MDEKYLHLLKKQFSNREAVLTEIINLSAICELPKATEHFVSDIHGEYAAFNHVLRNGSGSIKEKLKECFPDFSGERISDLSTLIYYPQDKLTYQKDTLCLLDFDLWCQEKLIELIKACKYVSQKYTRSKVRKAFPEQFRYILEELLIEEAFSTDKKNYFESIIQKLLQLGQLSNLMIALADTIRRLTVDHLHVVGDIYDRGPFPDKIIDRLMGLPSVDIQWGNHDIVWMATIAGSPLAMMNVLRVSARYGNLDILEDSYGINLRPLIEYAQKYYEPLAAFAPHLVEGKFVTQDEMDLLNRLQQAAAILQFKLESQLIARRPEFILDDRDILQHINFSDQTIKIKDQIYPLVDFNAPTIDPLAPEKLTFEELHLTDHLLSNFQTSEKLHKHVQFLLEKGGMYLCYNGNLLIHGCLPLHENGDFKSFRIEEKAYSGKALLDFYDRKVRESFLHPEVPDDLATDLLWYLWVGECSSLFGKKAMTTFERYYIADKKTHAEIKNAYYALREKSSTISHILENFGLSSEGHLINGHTPIKEKNGENPIKADGKLIVIDGGFSKPYQKETGIAGYTLLYNSFGMQLSAHQPFSSIEEAVRESRDMISVKRLVDKVETRQRVRDTNIGQQLLKDIADLEILYDNYDRY